MNDLSLTTLESGRTTVSAAALEALSAQLRGAVLAENDAAYDGARIIWNAMIDRRPGLIAQCAGASDVVKAVRYYKQVTGYEGNPLVYDARSALARLGA